MTLWELPRLSDEELESVEQAILRAYDSRSVDHLRILGLGELGLAVGWPTDDPVAVCKRQAAGPAADVESDAHRMQHYQAALEERGARVLPTDLRALDAGNNRAVPYLVQPIVPPEQLAENIIAADDPRPNHPILTAVRDIVLNVVTDQPEFGLSIDAQITNFAVDADGPVLLDFTPPLIWDSTGGPFYDIGAYLSAIPLPLRPTALKLTRRSGDRYRTARDTLRMTAVYLKRIDQERWVDSALATFNDRLDEPLRRDVVDSTYDEMIRDLPMIKRLARVQRAWQTRVRRRRYEFFITNSFTGEIL